MEQRIAARVLGIGNVLWADEGFGVRAVEALNAAFEFPDGVELQDGGTLGLALFDAVASARRVLVFDAVDFNLAPGTIKVLRDAEVPAWGATKLSPHQTGFNDVLALAAIKDCYPEALTVIGVQPVELSDFGGSLRPAVRACIAPAVALAAQELAAWGLAGRARADGETAPPLNASALALDDYERGRPSEADACRIGDERLLAPRAAREGG